MDRVEAARTEASKTRVLMLYRINKLLTPDQWAAQQGRYLPTDVDKTHVRSLMQPVYERGKIASWIAPPRNGINGKPFDYDYVHLP